MASATLHFNHPVTGAMKDAPVGFSWTTLFFGFIPALLRGHWVGAVVQLVLSLMTFGISGIVFAFIYNKMYVKYLLGEGFKVKAATQDVDGLKHKLGLNLEMIA